jgi:hypothetical protein
MEAEKAKILTEEFTDALEEVIKKHNLSNPDIICLLELTKLTFFNHIQKTLSGEDYGQKSNPESF